MHIRGEPRKPPVLQQISGKGGVILVTEGEVERTAGKFRLYQYFTGNFAATGSTRHLGKQRVKPLGCPEVSVVQQTVGIDYADQIQVYEVVTFSQYLRPDQDIDFAVLDLAPHRRPGKLAPRAVAVDTKDVCAR